MYEFALPDLGEGIHEAEILKWHVNTGDRIEEDEPLVDVETDKAAVTIPSPKAGTIMSTTGELGDVVIVGQVIATIDEGSGAASARSPAETVASRSRATVPSPAPPEAPKPVKGPVPAAPATRRLARELGVDIRQVPPTGPGGRVTPDDVFLFSEGGRSVPAASPLLAPVTEDSDSLAPRAPAIPYLEIEPLPDFSALGPVRKESLRSIRRKVARKMVTAKVLVPHVVHMDEADVTELEDFRIRYRETHPDTPPLSLLAFTVKAVVAGLRQYPMFNASLDPVRDEIVYKHFYNVGFAADTPRGLMVPVVEGADRKSFVEVARAIRELAIRGRDGTIEHADMQGGTFTITNIGPFGGIALAPAVNYPEVAIMGMGTVQEKPVVRDGEIVIRKILPVTLSFDHRVADGADAARFVSTVVRLLSNPEALFVEV